MVVTLNDSGLHASVSFDPRTGQSHFVRARTLRSTLASLAALAKRGGRPLAWASVAASLWLAWQGAQWALQNSRSRRLRRAARECTELEELAALLYSIAPGHLGGFLTNATVEAVERAGDEVGSEAHGRVLLFASGGWRYTPHSLTALPMHLSYPSPSGSGSRDARSLYWLATTLGKGTVLNGSLAFLLSMMMMQAEKEGRDEGMQVRFRGRRIRNIGLCTGQLYHNLAAMQRPGANAAAAAAAAAGADAVHPITRLELVCEIGNLSPERVMAFQQMHWGQTPDPRSPQLADVADFGTSAVLDYWRANGRLPDAQTPGFEGVLWEKRGVNPPAGKDVWMWFEVDAEDGQGEEGSGVERFHLDMGVYFARGLSAGFQEDREREEEERRNKQQQQQHKKKNKKGGKDAPVSAVASAWSSLRGAFSALQLRLSSLLPASVSSSLFSSSSSGGGGSPSPLFPFSSLPRPMLLPHGLVSDTRGLASRIHESAEGSRDCIAMLQRLVLINSQEANTTHTQMRSVLLDALHLCGLKNRWLVHRIPPQRHARTATPPGGASAAPSSSSSASAAAAAAHGDKAGWPAPNVEQQQRGSKVRQGRSARQRQQRRAKQQQQRGGQSGYDSEQDETEIDERAREEEEEDEDEDAIDVDTDTVRRQVDDVD